MCVSTVADGHQIEHVTSKVSMVETMHDGLRLALEGLRRDVKDGTAVSESYMFCCPPSLLRPDLNTLSAVDIYRTKLNDTFSTRFAECEVST